MAKFFYHRNVVMDSFEHISLDTIYFYFCEINNQEIVWDVWLKR